MELSADYVEGSTHCFTNVLCNVSKRKHEHLQWFIQICSMKFWPTSASSQVWPAALNSMYYKQVLWEIISGRLSKEKYHWRTDWRWVTYDSPLDRCGIPGSKQLSDTKMFCYCVWKRPRITNKSTFLSRNWNDLGNPGSLKHFVLESVKKTYQDGSYSSV